MVKVANYLGHDVMTDKQVVPKQKRTVAWIKANWREPLAGTIEDVDPRLVDADGFYHPTTQKSDEAK
jgi:hypothetical protein